MKSSESIAITESIFVVSTSIFQRNPIHLSEETNRHFIMIFNIFLHSTHHQNSRILFIVGKIVKVIFSLVHWRSFVRSGPFVYANDIQTLFENNECNL